MTDKIERDDKLTCIDRLRLHAEDPETFPADFDDISETVDLVDRLRSSNEAMAVALTNLVRKASTVASKGAVPGHHFVALNVAVLQARAALSTLKEEDAR